MSEHRTYTPDQEAQITQRIGQAFDFLSDVLEDPSILDDIPTESILRFSEVLIGDTVFHLTAYPDAPTEYWPVRWTARVTGPARWAAEGRKEVRHMPPFAGSKWSSPPAHPEHGHTPEEALATLEEKLRDSRHRFEAGTRPGRRSA